jgi:phenylalanyl-tRNA synthetase alpha chain
MIDIEKLKERALSELEKISDVRALEIFRVAYLGRKSGRLTAVLKSLKHLAMEKRRRVGFTANELRKELEILIERKKTALTGGKGDVAVDVTRPHRRIAVGRLHPLTIVEQDIRRIFLSLGFSSVEGPEIETEYYNFDALNIPADHPAREMWDTLWLKSGQGEVKNQKSKAKSEQPLLRTHTSPMQVRYMETHRPPFQIIVPGRVFRNEATDASHEVNFYQIEGLMVGEHVSLANFMYVMDEFFKRFFRRNVAVRYRPSYFPFVEPGLEIDVKIDRKSKVSPSLKLERADKSKKSEWLEIAGAGMVHPNVFVAAGYDPRRVKGFAFGFGMDRLAMIRYHISDIRLFYSGDLRFINQPYR